MRKRFYEDPKENAAFERCADVMTELILKYGPVLKQRWARNSFWRNVWIDIIVDFIIARRLSGYHRLTMIHKRKTEKGDAA